MVAGPDALVPQIVANAGTPLMWVPILQLLFGNLLIALLEATALRLLFRVRFGWGFGLCVVANYASMIVGFVLFPRIAPWLADQTLGAPEALHFGRYVASLIIIAFVGSFAIEWPIIRLAWQRAVRQPGRTVPGVLVAQVISHAVLIFFYGGASLHTLHREAMVQPRPDFAAIDATVYFIAPDGRSVRQVPIRGGESTHVLEIDAAGTHSALIVARDSETNRAGLWFREDVYGFWREPESDVFLMDLGEAGHLPIPDDPKTAWQVYGGGTQHVAVHRPGETGWTAGTGSWAAEGVFLRRDGDPWNLGRRLAVELPLLAWDARFPSMLPSDQVVYNLGPYIVLYDIDSRKLAIITEGRAPAVLPAGGD